MERVTPILHLTDRCNLQCEYCYVSKNTSVNSTLSKNNIDTLVVAIKKILSANAPGSTRLILHGGEPLIVSPILLDELFSRIKKIDSSVIFSLQTNLTLLNNEFCELFNRYRVHVGFSLDGCNETQNQYRKDRNGNLSFSNVMQKYKLARKMKIAPGAIITVNKTHINHERELIDFIDEHHLKCDIRPAYPTGNSNICMTPQEYAVFMNNLFDIWLENDHYETFNVSNFESEIREILGGSKECRSCSKSANCGQRFLSLDPNGECYPCNRLHGIPEFYLGNLAKVSFDDIMLASEKITSKRWKLLKDSSCMNCEITEYCHGGCPAIAYSVYHDYNQKDYFCESYQLIRKHIKMRISD